MADDQERIELFQNIRDEYLKRMLGLLREGEDTAQDRATLGRILEKWGWDADPNRLPGSLEGKLTKDVEFDDDLSAEEAK